MADIEKKKKPKAYAGDGRFYLNKETGQEWKVKLAVQERSTVEGGAASLLAVTVTVSPVDAEGKALREDDKPIIVDGWTHTFSAVEMAAPDFDPEKRLEEIIAARVDAGEGRVEGVRKIRSLVGSWASS